MEGWDTEQDSNSPTLSPQHFHLLCPQHKEGSGLGEPQGDASLGLAHSGVLGSCSHRGGL